MSIYHCPAMSCILLVSVLDILILSTEMSFKVPSNKALHCPEKEKKKCCGFHVPCFNVGSEGNIRKKWVKSIILTAWKVSKYGVFSGRYFPAFGLNTERYSVSVRIQPECGKIQTRKNSVFEHFSGSSPPSNGEGLRDIQHSKSMVLDTRFHIWFIMTLYYELRQILLQYEPAILLQNVAEVY